MIQNPFRFNGPLDPNRDIPVCVPRPKEIDEIGFGILKGEYWAILGPRQIGKTTLLNLIQDHFKNAHYIYFNCEIAPNGEKDFYQWIISRLEKEIPANQSKGSWAPDDAILNLSFLDYLESFVPDEDKRIILLFDEIDGLPFLTAFLRTWRVAFHNRIEKEELRRYILITTGGNNLVDLTIGATSPFNIANVLNLDDFTPEESKKLVDDSFSSLSIGIDEKAKEKLLSQLNGHPQMLQQTCNILLNNIGTSRKPITETDVDDALEELLRKSHVLDTLRQDITRDSTLRNLLWDIFTGEKKKFFPHTKYAMLGAGAIKETDSFCTIRNEIYKKYFGNILKSITDSTPAPKEPILSKPQDAPPPPDLVPPPPPISPKKQIGYVISTGFVVSILTGLISLLIKYTPGLWVSGILALITLLVFTLSTPEINENDND